MNNIYLIRPAFLLLLSFPFLLYSQNEATFEELQLSENEYWNGVTSTYGNWATIKEDSVFRFKNHFSRSDFGYGLTESWNGFAYSRMKDDTTAGFTNQYSAITAIGADNSENYGVFFLSSGKDTVWLSEASQPDSVFITNATYPYLSMKDGDAFAKKFGGETGDEPDWFLLTIIGIHDGQHTDTIDFYLADFRFENNEEDYIVDEWTKVDLSGLGTVDMIEFRLSSSDIGDWGMNTPAYFCIDNISGADFEDFTYTSGDYWNGVTASFGQYASAFTDGIATFPNVYSIDDYGFGKFESWTGFAYSNMQDSTTKGFTNQYSAYPAAGANGSSNYALCFNSRGRDTIKLTTATELSGAYFTNGTYGALSMLEGDMFAKKFGGESGNDPDWFLLTIRGLTNGSYTDSVLFYLADYRFENNEEDYIVTEWEWVDLSGLGMVDMVEFSLTSSDVGDYGINTPAYFFVDNFNSTATGIKPETLISDQFNIYPNPVASTVSIEGPTEIISVRIMDLTGKIIENFRFNGMNRLVQMQLDHLNSGLYFIQIEGTQDTITKRIIKK